VSGSSTVIRFLAGLETLSALLTVVTLVGIVPGLVVGY
jgi:hypothetical protein